jgi:hypothetical protein
MTSSQVLEQLTLLRRTYKLQDFTYTAAQAAQVAQLRQLRWARVRQLTAA